MPEVTAAAPGIVSFLYAAASLVAFNTSVQVRDFALFLFGVNWLPGLALINWTAPIS
jgi:hypothetical protein